jgi:hypothetical protein
LNYTNEEFEMMMQSLKDREQAMRVLRILKQEEKTEDAAQNAEFGTNNERNAEFRMQNAEARTVNAGAVGGAIVKQSESNGKAIVGSEISPLGLGNRSSGPVRSAFGLEKSQEGTGKQLEPFIMKEKREPDYAFWEETSENVPHVSPSFPDQHAESLYNETSSPQFSMVAQGADASTLPASLGLRSAFIPHSGQQNSAPWGALPGRELPGEFPLTALPSLALAMVVNVCDSVQVSYGMTACMVLGAVSAAAAGRLSVRVSADYEEPLQLFIAVGANPSERKSACMGMVFHSLNEYEVEENLKRAPAVKHCKESKELLEEGIARAKKSGDRMKMADLIDELNSMQEVKAFELMLTDATPEALSKSLVPI